MKIAVREIVSLVSIFIMVWASGDSMWFAMHKKIMFGVALFGFFLLAAWNIHNERISRNLISGYLFLAGLIAASMVFNLDFTGYTQWFFAAQALLLVCTADFEAFCRQFNAIAVGLCVFSLAGMYVYMTMPALLDGVPIICTPAITAKNLWVTCVPLNRTLQTFRNYGIFYEPGKFAIYIGIALLIQLYVLEKPSMPCIGIYLLTLLTTRSTTGIAAVVFLLCLWLLTGRGGRYRATLIFGLSLVMLCIVALRGEWISEFLGKFNMHGASAESVNSRLASFLVGIWIGISHPFAGAGAVKSQIMFGEIAGRYFGTSCFANMVTYLFSAFGAFFLCFLLLGFWGVGMHVYRDKKKAYGIVLFFILLYGGQGSIYSHCFYAFVFYGWSYLHRSRMVVWNRTWVKIG